MDVVQSQQAALQCCDNAFNSVNVLADYTRETGTLEVSSEYWQGLGQDIDYRDESG